MCELRKNDFSQNRIYTCAFSFCFKTKFAFLSNEINNAFFSSDQRNIRRRNEGNYFSIDNVPTFLEKSTFSTGDRSPVEKRLKARVQLDKRRIKLICPRSESNRALQSRGKAGARFSVKRMTQIFPRKSEPAFPVLSARLSTNERDRESPSCPTR